MGSAGGLGAALAGDQHCDNLTDGLPHLVGPTELSEGCSSFTRGSCEIWEMHKFKHAPVLGKHFDLDGHLVSPLASADRSLGRTCPRKCGTQNELSPNAGRWLQLMASGSRQHGLRFSDSDSMDTSQSRPTSQISSTNRSCDHLASPQPQTYPQWHTDFPSASSRGRQRAIVKLQEECSMITYQGVIWTMPPSLEWDTSFSTGTAFSFSQMFIH